MEAPQTDALTGLLSAWTWTGRYDDAPVFCPERTVPWLSPLPADAVFIALDVCQMNEVNYVHGHLVGDRVLAEMGRRLRRAAEPWPAYRTDGDEFLVAARLPAEPEIHALAERLRAEVRRPYVEGITIETSAAAARGCAGESPRCLFDVLREALRRAQAERRADLLIIDAANGPPRAH